MLYDGSIIAKETNVISIADSEETLMLEEESRSKMFLKQNFGKRFIPQQELSDEQAFRLQTSHPNNDQSTSSLVKIEAPREIFKVSLVNTSLKNLKYHLGQFDNVVKRRITLDALTEGEWGFEHTKAVFLKEIIPFLKTLKYIFNVFDKDLLNEITEVQTVFYQIEVVVQQYQVDKQCFKIQKKQFLIENDRLLDQIISQDIVNIVVNSLLDNNTSVNVNSFVAMNDYVNYVERCNKCLELEAELIKQHNMVEKDEYNKLSKRFSELEQHCISLEIAMQLNKEIFQKTNTSVNQTEPLFDQLFELNNLKVGFQEKDMTIKKLKEHIKRVNETSTSESVKKDFDEIETINIELEHKVTKLISENEHLKQTYKQLYDSIKPLRVCAKKKTESLVNQVNQKKLKGKDIVDNATTIAPGMYKLDPVILAPKVVQIIMWYLDSRYYKHMTGDRSQLTNFVHEFLGTVKFGNDQVAKIMGDMMASSPICLLLKATKTKSWLWHRRLSYLNFGAINHLARHGLVRGLPILKFEKDHLCSACAIGKSKKQSHKPKSEDINQEKLYLIHMDLCGPMRVASVNGKKYILVIVDDYSQFT
ncbi:retrovirus-related pol polyprotein from transposon TNT 1-94 [Tanacetum coccineum]